MRTPQRGRPWARSSIKRQPGLAVHHGPRCPSPRSGRPAPVGASRSCCTGQDGFSATTWRAASRRRRRASSSGSARAHRARSALHRRPEHRPEGHRRDRGARRHPVGRARLHRPQPGDADRGDDPVGPRAAAPDERLAEGAQELEAGRVGGPARPAGADRATDRDQDLDVRASLGVRLRPSQVELQPGDRGPATRPDLELERRVRRDPAIAQGLGQPLTPVSGLGRGGVERHRAMVPDRPSSPRAELLDTKAAGARYSAV